jgi:predicted patatin/cPLA2 family phospholipase
MSVMSLSYFNKDQAVLIVEGGAMRSVFSAGLLDGFLKMQFNPFNYYFGVSAGAYTLSNYLAGVSGASLQLFRELATNRRFINYRRFVCGGHLLDLDWLIEASFAEARLDEQEIYRSGRPFYVCTTDIATGQAVYIKTTPDNLQDAIKASSSLPLLYRDFPLINKTQMTDGGVADGIPVAEAIRLGAKRIMVVRSRHIDYVKRDTFWHKFIRWKLSAYPALTQTMRERVKRFEDVIRLIRNPPEGVKILEICPPDTFSLGRFSRNRTQLLQGYTAGVDQAEAAVHTWTQL